MPGSMFYTIFFHLQLLQLLIFKLARKGGGQGGRGREEERPGYSNCFHLTLIFPEKILTAS